MESLGKKILIVDDETDILEFLSYNLKKEGFVVSTADNGIDAVQIAKEMLPHLIILDVMMPETDGIETCYKLRQIPELDNTLILFLTARSEDYTQIAGFDAGADDYITKPVKPRVLVHRINALLRRYIEPVSEDETTLIEAGKIKIDRQRFVVIIDEKEISMPRKEFELIELLASKPEKVFTREEIYMKIWGEEVIVGDRTIDVHIRKLREKIGDEYIKTIKGVGYKFEIER